MRNLKISAIFALLIALYAQLCAAQQNRERHLCFGRRGEPRPLPAVRSNDQAALAKISARQRVRVRPGSGPERREREHFARKYDEMHGW